MVVRYVRLPVRRKYDMRYYVILRTEGWDFVIDVSGQPRG